MALTEENLRAPYAPSSLGGYSRELWRRRGYMWFVPKSTLRGRHINTILGNFWHLLNPLLLIGVYYVIFGLVLESDRGVDNFIGFLASGIFAFGYTQRSVQTASSSMTANQGLLNTFSFPRAMLPLTSVVTEGLAFMPGVAVMLSVAVLSGEDIRLSWLVLPAILLWQTLFNAGLALIVARAATNVLDLQNLLPFAFRLLFYGSGVLFAVDAYVDSGAVRWLFYANPMYDFLVLYRWAVMGRGVEPQALICATIWTVAVIAIGVWWFRRGERTYGA